MGVLFFILVVVFMPFISAGIIVRVKSLWAGRRGQPVIQPFYDFMKYMSKSMVVSVTTTPVFFAAQVISCGAVLLASCLVPICSPSPIVDIEGGFIIFAYLFGLSKFMSLVSAMDTGSSFGGMGASREASFTAFIEPAFFVIMATAAAVSGKSSFSSLGAFAASGTPAGFMIACLASAALFVMILTEGSRVPVDDPATHLELTMIHEAMVLDNSGPDMALVTYTQNLKMVLLGSLIALLFIPAGSSPMFSLFVLVCVILTVAVTTGCIESLMARLRMTHVPQFVFFMSSIAAIIMCATFIFMSGGAR